MNPDTTNQPSRSTPPMKRALLAAAIALLPLSALAAEPDPLVEALNAEWQAAQTQQQHLRQPIMQLIQDRVAMQQQIADLRAKCGAPCTPAAANAPAPAAQAAPAPPPAPAPDPKP